MSIAVTNKEEKKIIIGYSISYKRKCSEYGQMIIDKGKDILMIFVSQVNKSMSKFPM